MGIFDFLKGKGKKVSKGNEAADIQNEIHRKLGNQVENLNVSYNDGTVKLSGMVDYHSTKQKAVLLAGNVEGVEKVDDSGLIVKPLEVRQQEAIDRSRQAEAKREENFTFYTIESGDSLSKIAKRFYGDANKWRDLYEANDGVIEDPDKIYPGQTIRVPAGNS